MLSNNLIRQALKESLTEVVQELIEEIDNGKFDTVEIHCECGLSRHDAVADYCCDCGRKLEKAAANGSL